MHKVEISDWKVWQTVLEKELKTIYYLFLKQSKTLLSNNFTKLWIMFALEIWSTCSRTTSSQGRSQKKSMTEAMSMKKILTEAMFMVKFSS